MATESLGVPRPAARALAVCSRLIATYGDLRLLPRRGPMHELIATMLSHRTTQKSEALAYERMWRRFGSWEAIRDADVGELAAAIDVVSFAEAKAANIQTAIRAVTAGGDTSLEFLRNMDTEAAKAWLMDLPGVGVKTASLVLLFCFGKPVLPVDTHVHRVSQRLGLIGPKVGPGPAHEALLALLPADPHCLYNFHVAMLHHGQRVCTSRASAHDRCSLTDL
ncbi:MAG: endonuclease III domain-containing protein, partial [Anaerolineae bacterium]